MGSGYALALGKFDALHVGHRALYRAAARHGRPLLISFSGMAAVLGWEPRQPLLAPIVRQQILAEWAAACGDADGAGEGEAIIPFAEVAHLDGAGFVDYLRQRWDIAAIISGEDFCFGAGRSSNVSTLRQLGAQHGFHVETIATESIACAPVSSSAVRTALDNGDMYAYQQLMARPHRIYGTVIHGEQRGRTIGFPTANISNVTNYIPTTGVYAASVYLASAPDHAHTAAVNIGHLPSISAQRQLSIEAHLLDWSGDCYGETISVAFHQHIRPEKKFPDLAALTAQITQDIHDIRSL